MKIPYKNIYNVLNLNRFIVYTVVICAMSCSAFSVWTAFTMHQKSLNSAFAISTKGSVIPLKLVEVKENFEVEAMAHLELFHQDFYGIDASNYKRNLEKALWLGDRSVSELYQQKKSEGIYNRLLQYSLIQKVLSIDSELEDQGDYFSFRSVVVFEIRRGEVTDTYQLTTSGNLLHVDRNFPHNPHGLLVTDFFENALRKLENYEDTER